MIPLFDTNVFLSYKPHLTRTHFANMALSVVVLYELRANPLDQSLIQRYESWRKEFAGDGMLLTPTMSDWWETARIVSRLREQDKRAHHGQTPPLASATALQNDALIARTAFMHRPKCTVITANTADFARLRDFWDFPLVHPDKFFGLA